jgi:hypothetical protein
MYKLDMKLEESKNEQYGQSIARGWLACCSRRAAGGSHGPSTEVNSEC